jgi:hypothetical protein
VVTWADGEIFTKHGDDFPPLVPVFADRFAGRSDVCGVHEKARIPSSRGPIFDGSEKYIKDSARANFSFDTRLDFEYVSIRRVFRESKMVVNESRMKSQTLI